MGREFFNVVSHLIDEKILTLEMKSAFPAAGPGHSQESSWPQRCEQGRRRLIPTEVSREECPQPWLCPPTREEEQKAGTSRRGHQRPVCIHRAPASRENHGTS